MINELFILKFNKKKKMNCIIVDDDPIALRFIKQLVLKSDSLQLVGECSNAEDALTLIENNTVDLVFLDIEMPSMSGIEMIKNSTFSAQIILVSSHNEYAAEAFEYNVTDFLTKPIEINRFLKSVDKAIEINDNLRSSNRVNKTGDLYVKQGSRLVHINERDILYIEALADYVAIHCENKEKYTILSTMKSIEFKLSSEDFFRIHRSYIIRLEKIKVIEDDTISIGNQILPISRTQKPILFQKLHLL
jgi:DNA-binding LytR/AlgR family response regulator